MSNLLILVVLASPPSTMCQGSRVVLESTPSPCTGILVSEQQSRKALNCLRVDLPKMRADLELTQAKASAEIDALRIQLTVARTMIEERDPPPVWALAVGLAGSLLLGVLAGGFAVGVTK
jgi:hypothetical protein